MEAAPGTALGAENATNSLGQASDPLVGGVLIVWQMNARYLLSGGVLVALALVTGGKRWPDDDDESTYGACDPT